MWSQVTGKCTLAFTKVALYSVFSPINICSGSRFTNKLTNSEVENQGLSAGTGKLCIFGHLGLVFIWSCFVSCLLLLLYYVICAPVLTEGTGNLDVISPLLWKTRSLTELGQLIESNVKGNEAPLKFTSVIQEFWLKAQRFTKE